MNFFSAPESKQYHHIYYLKYRSYPIERNRIHVNRRVVVSHLFGIFLTKEYANQQCNELSSVEYMALSPTFDDLT